MQVSVEDISSVKKVMHIEVPQEDVVRELDDAYKDLKKTAKVKGFRKGKAPRSVLERIYRKSVNADVSQKLLQQSLLEAIQETKLEPLSAPVIDPPELDEKGPFKFDATIEIIPELEDLDYKGLNLTRTNYKANSEEVETQLKMIQKTIAEKVPVEEDRSVQDNDFVLIDYEASRDGKPVPDIPKMENYTLKVGAGVVHKDLDDQIIGMKKGESKKITVSFPEHHVNQALVGAEVTFDVLLKEIKEEKLPEINDEFAKKLGPFQNLEELKKQVMENLKEGYEKRIEQELNEQIFQSLLERNDFEAPEHLVNLELDHIISDIEKKVELHDKSMEELGFTREGLAEKHRETAEKQAKRQILLNKLVKQEKLELSDEELEQGFEEMSNSFKQPAQVMKKYYETNPEQLNIFKQALLEKKAMKLIIENSSITDIEPGGESNSEVNGR